MQGYSHPQGDRQVTATKEPQAFEGLAWAMQPNNNLTKLPIRRFAMQHCEIRHSSPIFGGDDPEHGQMAGVEIRREADFQGSGPWKHFQLNLTLVMWL